MGRKRSRNSVVDGKRKEAPEKAFHHSVYVILLDPAVLQHPSILRLNPNRDPAKPCVYVGMTGLAVQDRFQNHKEGRKSALPATLRVAMRAWHKQHDGVSQLNIQ